MLRRCKNGALTDFVKVFIAVPEPLEIQMNWYNTVKKNFRCLQCSRCAETEKRSERIGRKGKLQRFFRTLNKKGFLSKEKYENIYPNGSQPARLYDNPKTHKLKSE